MEVDPSHSARAERPGIHRALRTANASSTVNYRRPGYGESQLQAVSGFRFRTRTVGIQASLPTVGGLLTLCRSGPNLHFYLSKRELLGNIFDIPPTWDSDCCPLRWTPDGHGITYADMRHGCS